jgi:predicted ribosome quality control (RQC) complex YloA/Tae2 family protein
MDQFLLRAAAEEAAGCLNEQEILRVSHLGSSRYLLRFATSKKDNLLISVRPDLPRIHLLAPFSRAAEAPHDRFAAFLDQEIAGAVAAGIKAWDWDRVLEIRFRLPRREDGATERRLVVELFGRSANVLLLDERGAILAYARDLKSGVRAPIVGKIYEPPPGRERFAALPAGAAALPVLRERFDRPEDFLREVSPLLARDLETLAALRPGDVEKRLGEILETADAGRWSPVIYSTRPLQDWSDGDSPGRGDLVISPLPLLFPPGGGDTPDAPVTATRFNRLSEAAEAGYGLLERLRDFAALRDHHRSLVARETGRLDVLAGKLREEMGRARACDRHRTLGEALLAGLGSARIEGSVAIVPDPYGSQGLSLEVPIDRGLSLQENAQRLFARYKKEKRGLRTIESRLAAVQARLQEWHELAGLASSLRGPADLDRLREEMGRLGLVHSPRDGKPALSSRAREQPARVRRHESPDGLVILVGRSGPENDTLTFRVASPWDFWMHAAGQPGAHVVVRNPQRLKVIPEATLRAAAEIAAYYSGARADGKVEVHYTQRKHVRKRKGMPAGQVLVRRFRTVQVTPRLAGPPAEEI